MNIAIIEQGYSKYLFEVPESITLKEGEKVKCDTKRGVTDGTVWADSITADEPTAKLIGELLGAKFPLKSVVGKAVTSVEMFEQPEPKREPVKLYCVKDAPSFVTKGNIYELPLFIADWCKTDGVPGTPYKDYFEFAQSNSSLASCLVPLVSRPAKVGEWVLITSDSVCGTEKGEICEVVAINDALSDNRPYLRTKEKTIFGYLSIEPCTLAKHGDYLVLDGYQPEPEYYSGKVVCVKATDARVTAGKAYTVENGIFTWDNGTRLATKASTIEQFNNWFIGAKFIEFKGE